MLIRAGWESWNYAECSPVRWRTCARAACRDGGRRERVARDQGVGDRHRVLSSRDQRRTRLRRPLGADGQIPAQPPELVPVKVPWLRKSLTTNAMSLMT